MRKFIKKYVNFDKMKMFYPVADDQTVINSFLSIPMLLCFGVVMFLASWTMGNRDFFGLTLFSLAYAGVIIYVYLARNNIVKYRKYGIFWGCIMVLSLEYAALGHYIYILPRTLPDKLFELFGITAIAWLVGFVVKLPFIIKAQRVGGKKPWIIAKKCKKVISVLTVLFLSPTMIFLLKYRRSGEVGMEALKRPGWILAIHIFFSIYYIFAFNRFWFSIIFREEITAEIERERKTIEEKKANRRSLKRKKTEETVTGK